jgi:hypothetical protein
MATKKDPIVTVSIGFLSEKGRRRAQSQLTRAYRVGSCDGLGGVDEHVDNSNMQTLFGNGRG